MISTIFFYYLKIMIKIDWLVTAFIFGTFLIESQDLAKMKKHIMNKYLFITSNKKETYL